MRRRFLSVLLLIVLSIPLRAAAQQTGPVQVIRVTAGPAGTETNGVFTFSEERAVFSRIADREIIVFFQWQDVPGPHKLVALWSSGGTSASSSIDYQAADRRFGAYWRIPVTADMPLGAWSIEVTMDGRPAGRFNFEVTDAKVAAAASKRTLSHAELYERLNRLFVVFRRVGAEGRELLPAGGFLPDPQSGLIYTVLPAIDGTESLHAVKADGSSQPVTRLVGSHRGQQWVQHRRNDCRRTRAHWRHHQWTGSREWRIDSDCDFSASCRHAGGACRQRIW